MGRLREQREGRQTPRLALRPLELKQFFDFAIRIYRLNFLPMLLAIALLHLPMALVTTMLVHRMTIWMNDMQTGALDPEASPELLFLQDIDQWIMLGGFLLVTLFYQLLVLPLAHISICRLALQTLHGERGDLRSALRFARARYWPMQVALATYALPLLLLSVLLLLPVLALSGTSPGAVAASAGIALLLIWAGLIVTWLLWFRLFPALSGALLASEDPPVMGMLAQGVWYLKRAWELTSKHFWRCVGLLLLVNIAVGIVNNGVYRSIELVAMLLYLGFNWPEDSDGFVAALQTGEDPMIGAVSMVIAMVFGMLFPAFTLVYQFLLYYDLRFRREGLDLQLILDRDAQDSPRSRDVAVSGSTASSVAS